ncbi:unnamed protein product [Diabrotica balteata]|uniref:Saposin B-type domain-containing protein n=1 Tax=Diabrotica balteata TaxID=107213 RepID=A0A9N9T1N8_DIABA|nr:unnamed protein product [Diabrotica balteata]
MKTTLFLAVLACVGLTVYGLEDRQHCEYCEAFAVIIQNFAKQGIPLEEVEEYKEAICAMLPVDLAIFCDKELLPSLEKIYNNEFNSTSPQEICQELELC